MGGSQCLIRADNALVFHSIGALRKSVGLSALFLFLTITFMLLAIGTYRSPLSLVGLILSLNNNTQAF